MESRTAGLRPGRHAPRPGSGTHPSPAALRGPCGSPPSGLPLPALAGRGPLQRRQDAPGAARWPGSDGWGPAAAEPRESRGEAGLVPAEAGTPPEWGRSLPRPLREGWSGAGRRLGQARAREIATQSREAGLRGPVRPQGADPSRGADTVRPGRSAAEARGSPTADVHVSPACVPGQEGVGGPGACPAGPCLRRSDP